uniref:Uncharacterized protein n=1 Tax=Anguilla anguilla TaxID=7936 RepID=A0A0E9XMR5_ANGAN
MKKTQICQKGNLFHSLTLCHVQKQLPSLH